MQNLRSQTAVGMRHILATLTLLAAVYPAHSQEPDNAQRMRKAREYFINGTTLQIQGNRHAEAILEFQQALRYDSSSVTLAAIARSYVELRKPDLAMEYAQEAIERDSTSRDTWELIAEIQVMRGRYDEGIAAYEQILNLKPSKRHLYTLGRLYEPRNASKAIDVFERLVEMEPDEGVYLRLADLYERKRNVRGVLRSLERASQLDPTDPQIAARSAEIYVHEGMMPELRALLSMWRGRDIDVDGSSRVWGVAFSSILEDSVIRGMYPDDVRWMLDESAAVFHAVWPVMLLSGTVAMQMSDSSRARVHFDLATGPNVRRPEPYLEAGRVYLVHHLPNHAMQALVRGLAIFPEDARIWFLHGSAALEAGMDDVAVSSYKKTVSVDPTFADAWAQLGLVYDQQKKMDSSDAAYEEAIAIDADHPFANNNYAYSLALRSVRLERARALAWKAVQSEPNTAAYLDTYAYVLHVLDENERAKTYIERAISIGGNATHYEHYGDILDALGDVDGAVRAWQRSLERDPARVRVKLKIDKYR